MLALLGEQRGEVEERAAALVPGVGVGGEGGVGGHFYLTKVISML